MGRFGIALLVTFLLLACAALVAGVLDAVGHIPTAGLAIILTAGLLVILIFALLIGFILALEQEHWPEDEPPDRPTPRRPSR